MARRTPPRWPKPHRWSSSRRNWRSADRSRARAPAKALTQRGESPRQAEVSPACDRKLPPRGDTRWGAAGGELPVRNVASMNKRTKVNSIRPDEGTSLRALSEVRPAAQAAQTGQDRGNAPVGQPDHERVRNQTVNERKAAPSSSGGWRQNGRKRERDKQGDLPGPKGVHGRRGPKNRPAGVRASIVAKKRVTSVEPRDAGKWKREAQDE
jgi:hypothetical protein